MKSSIKVKALQLRKEGWSYNIISQKLGVSKSTLSHWLREVPYNPNEEVQRRISEGPAKSAILSHAKKLELIFTTKAKAALEIGRLTKRDLWMLGLGLYIGEGSKLYESIRVLNSDPDVIKLAMKWFREVCGLSTENFTVAIHLYPDTPVNEALKYWSEITKVPISQFGKTQVDLRNNKSRKKHRKLPHGTAHITIRSNGKQEHGVLLHRRIIGWIEEAYRQMRV